ncbi:MAG: hypothetical protein JNK35_06395 [Phycisphaerae bacterium]|nr:hypothetical protein [Phycisphaerae bacterium]
MSRLRASSGALVVLGCAGWVALSGVSKACDPVAFASAVSAHGVVPAAGIDVAVRLVPIVEILTGMVAVYSIAAARSARWGVLPLAAVFMCLAAYLAVVALDPPAGAGCGCGLSQEAVRSWWPLVVRNVALGACCA